MKPFIRIPVFAIATGLALLAVVLVRTTNRPALNSSSPPPPRTLQEEADGPVATAPELRTVSQRDADRVNIIPEYELAAFATVTVPVGKTLATVNGVHLTLENLVPIGQNDTGEARTLPKSSFDFLLRRAIEREVTMLAARNEGIQLTKEQEQRLGLVVQGFQIPETGQFYSSSDNAKVRFTARDLTALLLQESLMAKTGVAATTTEADVIRFHRDHPDQFDLLPVNANERANAWREMSRQIRQRLASTTRERYQSQLGLYLEQAAKRFNVSVAAF